VAALLSGPGRGINREGAKSAKKRQEITLNPLRFFCVLGVFAVTRVTETPEIQVQNLVRPGRHDLQLVAALLSGPGRGINREGAKSAKKR